MHSGIASASNGVCGAPCQFAPAAEMSGWQLSPVHVPVVWQPAKAKAGPVRWACPLAGWAPAVQRGCGGGGRVSEENAEVWCRSLQAALTKVRLTLAF